MLRWFLLSLALLILAVGLLTVIQSPDWSEWRLAVLAGEYGYLLSLLPLGLAAAAWVSRGSHVMFASGTMFICSLAIGLLLKPCVEAWQVGRTLPARLTQAFGPIELPRE